MIQWAWPGWAKIDKKVTDPNLRNLSYNYLYMHVLTVYVLMTRLPFVVRGGHLMFGHVA